MLCVVAERIRQDFLKLSSSLSLISYITRHSGRTLELGSI